MLICGIAIAIGLFLYNPFPLYFLNDDFIHIPLSGSGAIFQRNSFRPVCDWSIQLDYIIWGKTAWGYHLTNVLLHIVNSILVFQFVKQLCKTFTIEKAFQLALPVATLFFIYAFHSEAVFWIIGRSAALGVLFFLPACIFYLKRNKGKYHFHLSLLFFMLALMTYESVWIFPLFAAFILLLASHQISKSREWGRIGVVGVIFLVYLISRYLVIGEIMGGYESSVFISFDFRSMLEGFIKLLSRTFVPPVIESIYLIYLVIVWVGILFLLAYKAGRKIKEKLLLQFAIPLLAISVLPYLSLGIDTHTVEGERFLYMPSIFAGIFLIRLIQLAVRNIKWHLFFLLILFGYHVWFLTRAAGAYRAASLVTKTTFEEINRLHQKKVLMIDSLPQSYKGALIFRSGFAEGIRWLKEPGSVDNVFIHSVKEDRMNLQDDFKTEQSISSAPTEMNFYLQKIEEKDGFEKISIHTRNFNKGEDAYFKYTDSALQIFK